MTGARLITAAAVLLVTFLLPARARSESANLDFAPAAGHVGTPVTARGRGLERNARFVLVWRSADPRWNTRDGEFSGITAPETARVVAAGTSDARGRLIVRFTVPEDFGYLHDVELHAADDHAKAPEATQGFIVVPLLTLGAHTVAAGAPLALTVTGLGYRFYELVWHLLYDGAQTGWVSAVTTHGTAHVTIPASGAVGLHTLQLIEGHAAPYLNGEQSPNAQADIPQVLAATIRIAPVPALRAPPAHAQVPARAPVTAATLHDARTPDIGTNYVTGQVGTQIVVSGAHFAAHTAVALRWETLVGNRLSGKGWTTRERPFGTATTDAGGTFVAHVRTPEDLGGTHRIIARSGRLEAATAYTIVPSSDDIAPQVMHPGAPVTLHLHGVGWTQTANTYTTVLDNGFIGYECGFNSGGDVIVHIRAPGRIGVHYIDVYPTIYAGQLQGPGAPPRGSQVSGGYFLLPMLNAIDHPGEVLPAFHLSFEVR